MSVSESQLVDQLRRKETKGIDQLYDHYSSALYGIIFRIVGNEEIAKEVLQDAILRIVDKIDSYDPAKGRLFTWMLNITRNLSIDKTRSKEFSQARKSDQVGDNVYRLQSQTTEIKIEDIGVKELLKNLDPEQGRCMELVYFLGFSQADAANELDLPLGTVKSRIRAALKSLRELLDEH